METIWDAVARQARETPSATAIRGEHEISYQEVLERAAVLSRSVQSRVVAGDVVALDAITPTSAMIAMLAAAHSRCPIMPLNAASPPAHRAAMLADADPALILRETGDGSFFLEPAARHASGPRSRGTPGLDMRDVAYVMYTSGSTGRPKGVVVSHAALRRSLDALTHVPGFGPGDSILAMSAFSFDISMVELLMPLTVGGCLVAAPPETRLDPHAFAEVVRAYRPDVVQATPSFWRLALAWGWEGSPKIRLWSGGEALTPALVRSLLPRCGQLWNLYGPTECTIWATAAHITTEEAIGLGTPLPGIGICLEDDEGKLVTRAQPQHPGEILIYSDFLARGYLNLPDLTARQFRVCDTPEGPRLCYRSGDRAQYRADGTLQFLGRSDAQVKLRGHRIELTEIEAVLEEHPAVREAAVVVCDVDEPDAAYLAAFVVAADRVTPRQLRGWLSDRLPGSMRPSRISIESRLPRTTSGKVDRISLAKSAASLDASGWSASPERYRTALST